jgi:hypothetical protein
MPPPSSRSKKPEWSRQKAYLLPGICFTIDFTWLILRPWRWRRHVLPKYLFTFNALHGVITQKREFFITTAVRISIPTSHDFFEFSEAIPRNLRRVCIEPESVRASYYFVSLQSVALHNRPLPPTAAAQSLPNHARQNINVPLGRSRCSVTEIDTWKSFLSSTERKNWIDFLNFTHFSQTLTHIYSLRFTKIRITKRRS